MPRRLLLLVPLAALLLAAAGCGGSSSPQVASVASSTTTASSTPPSQNALVAFSRCMRSNGVPSFPDPQQYAGGNVKLTIRQTEGDSPHFHAAMEACSHLLPQRGGSAPSAEQQRIQLADELSFARCMRAHGVARFPDPTAQGQLSVEMVQAQGIDLHSPQVLRVVSRCLPASHGALTPAKVRAAIANAGG